ncbi:response regulator transcription factor [Gracilibacillus dipsosauri]|uniref:DNA-binding response regulator n=1 Tax=Gracilibacillus dipsosauri TaxID=178340 RepID=A0A317L4E7_9BACI|nr:response regulator transcription factor [Gracilibacillus dipsosauri]PWU70144.1 DNA-binding response regulator [Gracilibacillus dipsosauri]
MTEILIVEDEEKLARVLELELQYEDYQTTIAPDGRIALELLQQNKYALVLLDIMLPSMSGLEVLRRFRKIDPSTPVILLTAKDEVHDKVSGLDLGANDYITKPFQLEELLARIRAQLRNQKPRSTSFVSIDDLTVDKNSRDVKRGDSLIELTRREFDLLCFLVENKNQVFSRDQLLDKVWGFDYVGDTNVVDVYIRYLRNKIDKPFDKNTIHTVRGVGYTVKDSAL